MIREEAAEEIQVQDTSPKETLYIRNINEKIKPKGTAHLTQTSNMPCTTYSRPMAKSCRLWPKEIIK